MSKEGDSRFANVVAIAGVRSTEQSVFEQHQAAAGDSRFANVVAIAVAQSTEQSVFYFY